MGNILGQPQAGPVVIDSGPDHYGESFGIQVEADAEIGILDMQARDRYLLLMVRQPADLKVVCGSCFRFSESQQIPQSSGV